MLLSFSVRPREPDEGARRREQPDRPLREAEARATPVRGRGRGSRLDASRAPDGGDPRGDAAHPHDERLSRRPLRPLHQPVQGVRARLRVLLREADARLPGAVSRARLREQDLLEAGSARAPPAGARASRLPVRDDRARREHRSLPAGRARPADHARHPRGPRGAPPSRGDRDEVEPRAPGPRPPAGDGEREPGRGLRVDHDARSGARAADGAASADSVAPRRGRARAFRRGRPCWGAGLAHDPRPQRLRAREHPRSGRGRRRANRRVRAAAASPRGEGALRGVDPRPLSDARRAGPPPRTRVPRRRALRLLVRSEDAGHRSGRGADRAALLDHVPQARPHDPAEARYDALPGAGTRSEASLRLSGTASGPLSRNFRMRSASASKSPPKWWPPESETLSTPGAVPRQPESVDPAGSRQRTGGWPREASASGTEPPSLEAGTPSQSSGRISNVASGPGARSTSPATRGTGSRASTTGTTSAPNEYPPTKTRSSAGITSITRARSARTSSGVFSSQK